MDSSGSIHTTGNFIGTVDFDPGAGTANLTGGGIFVSKLDAGGVFVWAKSLGTGHGNSIAVDSSGNVYTTGWFEGIADFDPGAGTAVLVSAGLSDIFVSKLDSNGDFVWAKRMGGTNYDDSRSIALDPLSGDVYTTGSYQGTVDFDPGAGTVNLTSAGGRDIFVSKLDSSGNYVWARSMGGAVEDYGYGIVIDPFNNVFTTGYFKGTADFDPGAGTASLVSAGDKDIFVSKLTGSGSYSWAKNMGGTGIDAGWDIAVDLGGNVYTTGYFKSSADFDPGAGTATLVSAGFGDIFVSKLTGNGGYIWAKRMGGLNDESGNDIAVDFSGNVFTTGFYSGSTDFDPGAGIVYLNNAGGSDIFVSRLNGSGNFVWARSMGGANDDFGYGIALDTSSNVHTTGSFQGTADFDPGAGTANLVSAGNDDIFVSKLGDTIPSTFRSVAGNDGWILESGENTNAGGILNATATTFNLGDAAGNRQYRSILSFNTIDLPDNAVITKVTLRIRKQLVVGSDPFTHSQCAEGRYPYAVLWHERRVVGRRFPGSSGQTQCRYVQRGAGQQLVHCGPPQHGVSLHQPDRHHPVPPALPDG